MESTHVMETEPGNNSSLHLQEFCDMEQLYRLIDNWSKSSGMSAVIVDTEGNRTSDSFGMTEFCSMIHANENGMASCTSTWGAENEGIYVCPVGFCDFAIPIVLPDGQVLGKVLAGQALSVDQSEEEVLQQAVQLGLEEAGVRDALSRVRRKTQTEMEGSYELLKEMLHFFIEKNYSIWKTNNELKKAPAKKDRILSQITQIMYSYNLTVDLETETYTLITGTGMERTVDEYKRHSHQAELVAFHNTILHPAYLSRFHALLDFESAKKTSWKADSGGRWNTRCFTPAMRTTNGTRSMCLLTPKRTAAGWPTFWAGTSRRPTTPRSAAKRSCGQQPPKTRFFPS